MQKLLMRIAQNEIALGDFQVTVPATMETITADLEGLKAQRGAEGYVLPGTITAVRNYSDFCLEVDFEFQDEIWTLEFQDAADFE